MSAHDRVIAELLAVFDRLQARAADIAYAFLEFLVGFVAVYLLGRFVISPAITRLLSLHDIQPTIEQALRKTVEAAVIIVAIVAGLSFAGATSLLAPTAMLTAAMTLAVGFAAQDVLGNLVSGVFIVADPKLNIGDLVRFEDRIGRVEEISFRVTRIRTPDGELLTVPNAHLAKTPITNLFAADDGLRMTHTLSIDSDADLEHARKIVREAAAARAGVSRDPSPAVRVTDFGDGISLEAQFWVDDPRNTDMVKLRSRFLRDLDRRFQAAGIATASPQRQLTGDLAVEPASEGSAAGHTSTVGDDEWEVGDLATMLVDDPSETIDDTHPPDDASNGHRRGRLRRLLGL